ncbi:AraC family transcriptional regulator [Vibrio sp. S4M6]|uniref:AraC family transcriptional regulator n=1 Tax=Vibrio sinus TaxID=2946865 RepID=UPI00202A5E23|nr:AraC family transcriptional regulator [Vibrio sinus]MCL9781133.1 AraC family transcriptional regulator [Vibrio sinus]
MRAQFEKIVNDSACSWRLLIRELEEIPFEWHFHPEYELTLTLNSQGERYIDTKIEAYSDYDLSLIGPNIPHTWHSRTKIEPDKPHKVYVLWFSHQWLSQLASTFPEFQRAKDLAQNAQQGIQFPTSLAQNLLPTFIQLKQASTRQRLILLMQILDGLMSCTDYSSMHLSRQCCDASFEYRQQSQLNRILETVHQQYQQPLSIVQLAQDIGMSESTLNRFFKRLMGQPIIQYITDLRLAKACSLLIDTNLAISYVATQSGFHNLSNFNRLFKKYKQMTPRAFRLCYSQQNEKSA